MSHSRSVVRSFECLWLVLASLACGDSDTGGDEDAMVSDTDAGNELSIDAATDSGGAPQTDAALNHDAAGPDADDAGSDGSDAGDSTTTCTVGDVVACYTGPANTQGVGACTGGQQTCLPDGSGFGACNGQVLPTAPSCASGDVDCNGVDDGAQDLDGDGYTVCDDDCCDGAADGCDEPEHVNPGAFDFGGDGEDQDCSGTADDGTTPCDATLVSNSNNALDYANAFELCKTTTMDPAQMSDRTWGVVSAAFTLADGTGTPEVVQRSIRSTFGQIQPEHGSAFTVLSTGAAAATGQSNPAPVAFDPGYSGSKTSAMPADWLSANSNSVPQVPGCPTVPVASVHDPIMLTLKVRVPTNANSFSLRGYFLSAEYPEWVCSEFSDFFVALLDSGYTGTPANRSDKNIAVYVTPSSSVYPIGVGLAYGNTGLFRQCVNGTTGCSSIAGSTNTCVGTADLVGTGLETAKAGKCDSNAINGGGTGWLTFSGNVVPGELITLRLMLWDTGDDTMDSTVVLDHFVWSEDLVTPGTSVP